MRALFGGTGGEEEPSDEMEDKGFARTVFWHLLPESVLRIVVTIVMAMMILKRIDERDGRKCKMAIDEYEFIFDLISKLSIKVSFQALASREVNNER